MPTLLYGFSAMEHPELLPLLLPNGTQTKQFASYDTSGGNRDGGIERFRRYDENGEYVFFDEIGPGCLYRQQANLFTPLANFPSTDVHIRMYFDDESTPRLDMSFAEYFGKDGNYTTPFTPPLSFFATSTISWTVDPFANTYYPLPFRHRLKITASQAGGIAYHGDFIWYQYTYLKFPSGTPVESWAGPQVDSETTRSLLEHVGDDPKDTSRDHVTSTVVSIRSGHAERVLDLKGEGSIGSLRFVMDPWTPDTFYRVTIRIAWDDNQPAVDMPIGAFFGGGGDLIGARDVSNMTLKTEFFGFDRTTREFYSFWPMPYWSRARIEIVNNASVDIQIGVDAAYDTTRGRSYPKGSAGYFYAKRTVDAPPADAYYSRAFAARGQGKVMGIMMYSNRYLMDGDEFTYIDGSRTPQIHGDGTEDDHNQGWGGYAVQKPYWGGLTNGYEGAYRLYANDSYVFNSRIDIRYEHSSIGGLALPSETDCIVWYYLARPGYGNLRLTDEIDVGDATSERAHGYAISGETGSVTTISAYDRFERGDPYPTADDGRVFTGSSGFTVRIDPENEGVKLRRRANRNLSNVQRADVYVDGIPIADTPWYLCDLPAPAETAFVDTDFEIPAAYTRGKKHISVRVEHVAGQQADSTNEYYYWVFSYGLRRFSAQRPETPEMTAQATPDGRGVELDWPLALANARSYVIERREGDGGDFRRIGRVKGSVTSYVDQDVEPRAGYAYRIRARNGAGGSAWSPPTVVASSPSGPGR